MSTLTVPVSTDFSALDLDDVSLIDFTNPAGTLAAALLSDVQFEPGPIRADVAIDGSAGTNQIVITAHSIFAAFWTFSHWQDGDAVIFNGTASFDEVIGTVMGDHIFGFADNDFLLGHDGDDRIAGGAGADQMQGNDGNDTLRGGAGNDNLQGDGGHNVLLGDSGDDDITTTTSEGGDKIDGGAGFDGLEFYSQGNANIVIDIRDGGALRDVGNGTVIANVEQLSFDGFSGTGDDRIVGGAGDDEFYGGAGNDRLHGSGGSDFIRGGDGHNLLSGGGGDDVFLSSSGGGGDRIVGGAGFDRATLHRDDAVNYVIDIRDGGAGRDIGDGTVLSSIEALGFFGGDGADRVWGGAGDDLLCGRGGDDVLTGGGGDDTFIFNAPTRNGTDRITDFTQGADMIDLSGIDATPGLPGNKFSFIGNGDFSHTAGELRYAHIGGVTVIEADMTGDGVADLLFKLTSVINVVAEDFIL